ncbi:MAG: DUF1553 domain-containing protein [Verrucomicrobiaceae bacterium]|nr:DUF1553 domain-containing protein [Verrucomicrobiaceae bacterium]
MKHVLLLLSLAFPAAAFSADRVEFNRDVRPILSDKCFTCHGPDAKNQKSDFRIDTFQHATADLDGTFGIVPGKVRDSEVHHRIHSHDPAGIMPPPETKKPLTPEEIAVLDRWIAEGAEYEVHWSFVPLPETVEVPAVRSDWVQNEIDAFVFARLAEAGYTPAPETGREKWLRRVRFDLTGLPPTLTELDAFLADTSPEAYERVVDRLLASPAYAERMTAEWLDVARYSDSYGYQVDGDRRVWPWRDWVIRAFWENLPYDQFITWQLAGDLLPDPTRDQILATAFNRLHPQNVEGGSVPEEFRVEYVSDRLHTYGTAFLGLTMECSRCHDHKYDPITAEDYYRLSAYFSNIDEAGLYSFFTPAVPTPTLWLPEEEQAEKLRKLEAEIAATVSALERRRAEAGSDFAAWRQAHPAPLPLPEALAVFSFDEVKDGAYPNAIPKGEAAKTTPNNQVVPGKIGRAVQLTGDDAVTLPLGNFTRDDAFSVSLWMLSPDHKERAVIFSRSKAWTDAASRGYELLLDDGRLCAALVHYEPGNAIRVRATEEFPSGAWKHVTLTYDGSSRAAGVGLYVDGEPIPLEIVRDKLTREITGGGSDTIVIGQRMRDSGFTNGRVDDFRVYDRTLTPAQVSALAAGKREFRADLPHYLATEDAAFRDGRAKWSALRKERSALVRTIDEIMVMEEMASPRQNYLLERGLYSARGKPVSPGVPAFLPPLPEGAPNNRLGLARWTVDEANPLTARVTVNRYWQLLFANGLVATSEDFGSQGRLPTHPDLLDWLARDFVAHGWDLRHLLKQIVLSATYRQSSDISSEAVSLADPENTLLHHFPPARLSAEMLRDNALAISGLLVPTVGGPPVKPYDIAAAFKPSPPDKGENLYRRSVYTYMRQTSPSPLMTSLNASKRDVCQVKTERTDSPLQGLVMLNSPQFVEAARTLATRLVEIHGKDDDALLDEAFRRTTSRLPDEAERAVLGTLLSAELAHYTAHPAAATTLISLGDSPAPPNDEAPRIAAVTTLISTLLNFDECISKR